MTKKTKPKKRVKRNTTYGRTAEPLPPGEYSMTLRDVIRQGGSLYMDGVVTGRTPSSKPFTNEVPKVDYHKMTKKQLLMQIDILETNLSHRQMSHAKQAAELVRDHQVLEDKYKNMCLVRDDAMRTRDMLLETLRFCAQEGKFPRS